MLGAITFSTLLTIVFVSTLILILLVDSLVNQSTTLKLIGMGSSSTIFAMELDFTSVVFFSPYCAED